jgi:hypothetical protein
MGKADVCAPDDLSQYSLRGYNELHPPTGAMVCSTEAMTIFVVTAPE